MEEKINDSVGTLLRELRENKGWTLRVLGEKMNLDHTLLSKIERGERMPTKDQINAFSKIYKGQREAITIAWLSDCVVQKVQDEKLALMAIQVAEEKIKYGYY